MSAIDLRKLLDIPSELDKRSTDALIKSIKEHYESDFDYLKFMHSVKTLQSMDIDEATAYKSAFATAKTMGFTKDAFKKSVRHYLNVLSSQRENFADALKRQRAEKLTGQNAKNTALEEKIKSHKAKIKKLQDEIAIFEERLKNADANLVKEREKLETITSNFVNSYEYLESKLKGDLDSFENYI